MYVLFYVHVFCVHLLQITRDRAQMQETSVSSKTTETQNLKAGKKNKPGIQKRRGTRWTFKKQIDILISDNRKTIYNTIYS